MVKLAPVLAVEPAIVTVSTGRPQPGVTSCFWNWNSFLGLLLCEASIKYFVVHLMHLQDGVSAQENLSTQIALDLGDTSEMRVVFYDHLDLAAFYFQVKETEHDGSLQET